jgi:hypothetical protein
MFSPSKRKQGFGYKVNDEIKAGPLEVYGPLQNGGQPDTIHLYVILSTVVTSNICKRARLTKLSSNGPLVNRFSQHPNTKAEVQQSNAHYEADATQQPKDAKNDETNLHILAVSENARQLLKVLQPFDARITVLEAENTTLRMDSRNKEAMLQDLERKILRLQQDSQDRVTALEDEIADLQEQGQKDTDFLNEGIELARVSIERKNAMLKQLEAELQGFKLETKEKDETISALRSEVSQLEIARVKAEDELEWWKLENCTGDAEQNHLPKTPDSYREDDPRIQSDMTKGQDRIDSPTRLKKSPSNQRLYSVKWIRKYVLGDSQPSAATALLPFSSSNQSEADTMLVESKPAGENCFEEQDPIIKLPSITPCNAWTLAPPQPTVIPGIFVVRHVTSGRPLVSSQSILNNYPVIKINIPGQKKSKIVSFPTETCRERTGGIPTGLVLLKKRPTWSESRPGNEQHIKNLADEKNVTHPRSAESNNSPKRA